MIDTSSTTTETWARRVEAWRASGKRAEEFSRHEGYAASTLRWWSSKLKHEMPRAPEVVRKPRKPHRPESPTRVDPRPRARLSEGSSGVRSGCPSGGRTGGEGEQEQAGSCWQGLCCGRSAPGLIFDLARCWPKRRPVFGPEIPTRVDPRPRARLSEGSSGVRSGCPSGGRTGRRGRARTGG